MADDTSTRQPQDRPSERIWHMPTTYVNEQGEEVPSIENAQTAMLEAAVLLMRAGGVLSVATKRISLPAQGRFGPRIETEMLVIRWQQFTPVLPKAAAPAAPPDEEKSSE
jgi:hypothetical protein